MMQPGHTILIVDDTPEDCDLYRQYLLQDREYQYTIVVAQSGQVGLELWQHHQPDLVLLDYRLPDLDGVEFLAQLQTLTRKSFLPVIVVTGVGNEAIAVQTMKAGAQNYLVKGRLTGEELRIAVSRVIENVQLRTQQERSIERDRLFAQITRRINKSQNFNEIVQTTVTEMRQFLQADRMIVFQLHPEGSGNVVAESVGEPWRSILGLDIFDPCLAEDYIECYRQGLVTVKTDIYDGTVNPCQVELLARFQVRANLVVPIVHDNYFWGMLIAHNCREPRQWQQLEIDLLQELANHLSMALRLAEALQQTQNELAERKRAEASLVESEGRLRLALEAAHMGIWDWNMLTNQIQWSDNLEALFGLEPGEFDCSFEMFINSVHPQDRDRVQESVNAAMTTGAEYNIEFRVVHPDGSIRWALSIGTVFYNEFSQPVRMVGVDLDITERKRSEAELRENATWLKLAQKATKSALWDYYINQDKAKASEEFCTLLGLDPSTKEISYEQWLSVLHPDDRTRVSEFLAQMLREQQQYYETEFRIMRPDGERWLACRAHVFYDEAGNPIHKMGNTQDISERKQAEEKLRQSEEQRRLALDLTNTASWDWNLISGEVVWSDNMFQLLGLTPSSETLTYATWRDRIHPEDLEQLEASISLHLQNRDLYSQEYRVIYPDGSIHWLLSKAQGVYDPNSKPVRMVGITLDISERKQLEKEKELNELKSRFIAMISHEFRTPLSTIISSSELLEHYSHKWSHEKQITHLRRIQIAVKRITQILDDVLVLGKEEVANLGFRPVPLDLVEYCTTLVEQLQPNVENQYKIVFNSPHQSMQCYMDEKLLGYILSNLLSNAIKYSPTASTIQFTFRSQSGQAIFEIQDQGIGITAKDLPHLFESFYRGTNVGNIPGTGLGLTIVKKCVDMYHGEITVTSQVGVGTTFCVTLPFTQV